MALQSSPSLMFYYLYIFQLKIKIKLNKMKQQKKKMKVRFFLVAKKKYEKQNHSLSSLSRKGETATKPLSANVAVPANPFLKVRFCLF